jgi:CheY-like chemotaxis protein
MTLDEGDMDIYALLDNLEDMFRLKTQRKGLHLRFERDKDVPQHVRTDEVKLRQVLINLLSNAIKFTEEGKVELRIANCELRTDQFEIRNSPIRNLKFEIEDTGLGIASEELDKLFEAFTQTEAGRQAHEGTGLGLVISQRFVRLMGGDITVESAVGQGTTFSFTIRVSPVTRTTPTTQRSTSPKRVIGIAPGQDAPSAKGRKSERYRILVVDDNVDNRKFLIKLLEDISIPLPDSSSSDQLSLQKTEGLSTGFDFREAATGQVAIDIWKTWQPHLIWMALRMPGMDGYAATKEIRDSRFEIRDVPIIAVAASSFEEEQAAMLSITYDDFLQKPFQESAVCDLLHKHLGIQFVYEVGGPVKTGELAGKNEEYTRKGEETKAKAVLMPEALTEALSALPETLRMAWHEAVMAVDIQAANDLLLQMRQHNPALTAALDELVKQYRFDVLQEVFHQREQKYGPDGGEQV